MVTRKTPNGSPQHKWDKKWLKRWMSSRARKSEGLLEDYLAAKAQKEKGEAAEVTARAKRQNQEKRIRDQVEVQEFIKALNEICQLPPGAQKIGLVKLLEKNPGLAKEIQKLERLGMIHASRLKSEIARFIHENNRLLTPPDADQSTTRRGTSKH